MGLGFGSPLFFFAVAPEAEEGGEEHGEKEGEPCAVWNFREGGGEVQAVEGDEGQPDSEDEEGICFPDDKGNEGYEVRGDESDEDDADTVGMSEFGSL